MQSITLKEFCNLLGYYPNKKGKNLGNFADKVGVSLSYVSKLYNARSLGCEGPKWYKLAEYVKSYGYQLITANPEDYLNNNTTKDNIKLKTKIKYLENYIKLLEAQASDLQELIRISKRIAEYEKDKRGIKCKK